MEAMEGGMERSLGIETVEGEIALVISYTPGQSYALDVLKGAMALITAIDKLDHTMLARIDTALEPISILNDVQHSSLKMLLARAVRSVFDDSLRSLDWKKWLGELLVASKHRLLQHLDADAPQVQQDLAEIESRFRKVPGGLLDYTAPAVGEVQEALKEVKKARALLPSQTVTVQTELGNVVLESPAPAPPPLHEVTSTIVNRGIEFFKIKSVDMLGTSQWTVLRNHKMVRVDMLHQAWLKEYQHRQHSILPGDSLECAFEETIDYDAQHNELGRKLAVIRVVSPPYQFDLPRVES